MSSLVSAVITTCRREAQVVIRAAKSVLAQTYLPIELIVVDDSPADFAERENVKSAVCALDGKIRYVQHEVNRGACAARNTGLRLARGTYIAYLDDDDEWLPDKIEKQVAALDQNADAALVYCPWITLAEKTGEKSITDHSDTEHSFENLMKENYVGSNSFPLIRRSCLLEIDGFDEEMRSAQDYDTWLRLAQRFAFCYLNEPLVIYHRHETEQISTNPKKKVDGLLRLVEKNQAYLDAHPQIKKIRIMKIAPFLALEHRLFAALKIWCEASALQPSEIKSNLNYLVNILKNYCISYSKNKKP